MVIWLKSFLISLVFPYGIFDCEMWNSECGGEAKNYEAGGEAGPCVRPAPALNSALRNQSSVTSRPRPCSSRTSTLKLSGTPGDGMFLPFTIDSYARERPETSSDL